MVALGRDRICLIVLIVADGAFEPLVFRWRRRLLEAFLVLTAREAPLGLIDRQMPTSLPVSLCRSAPFRCSRDSAVEDSFTSVLRHASHGGQSSQLRCYVLVKIFVRFFNVDDVINYCGYRLFQIQHLLRFVVDVLQEQRLHLLNASMPFVLTVRIVQLHPDLSYTVALPVQPQHLVAELPDASGHLLELEAVFVVDSLHLLLHVCEVGGHVALHALGERLVDIVHRSQVPLVLPRLDLDESVVVTSLHNGVVHRERVVEVDVGDVLRKRVLTQPNDLLHSLDVVRLVTQFLQRLLSEVQMDVDVLRIVDVNVVRGVVGDIVSR